MFRFTTLRARLLAAFAFLLILTLLLSSVALLVVLRTQPFPSNELGVRLAAAIQLLQTQAEARTALFELNAAQERAFVALARTLQQRGATVRVIVLRPNGRIVLDTGGLERRGAQLDIAEEARYAPVELENSAEAGLTRGVLRASDGSEWVFLAGPVNAALPNGWRVVFAARAPQPRSLRDLVAIYGDDLLRPFAQAGLVGLIAALALSIVLARWVARPLQDIAEAARAIAQGQMGQRAPVRGPDEARTVALAFNHMIEQTAAAQQAQRDFLANVTHDLRTPLTSIQGFSQAIIEGVAADAASSQRAARIIYDEAARMNRMVEELLDLARIEAGRSTMTRHTVQLGDILGAVTERLTPRANECGVALTAEIQPLPPVAGDGDRLVQVFGNLVDNALKHTPSGGNVTLRAAPKDQGKDSGILVEVSDTGEGIPADDAPHIFDRFYQVDKSRERSARDGVGLGLAIARQIVEAHGGHISVQSREG
ncbi:MAG: HAMP domain-containing protein, partial [Anaerolineae bacterium]|nr:HAMP domain-containing protein [Anaerolineae bacterium]